MPVDKSLPFGVLHLTIKDFRGISDVAIPCIDARGHPSDILVVAGPNGSGKTTVLEALLLVLGHAELLTGPAGKTAIRSGAKNYEISVEIQTGHGRYESTVTATREAEWHRVDKRAKSLSPAIPPIWYFSSWRAPRLPGPLSITAGRKETRRPFTEDDRLRQAKQYLVNAKAHSLMNGPGSLSAYHETVERLNKVWSNFYPRSQESFAVEAIGRDPDEGFDVDPIGQDRKRISVDFLSSGQLEVFTFFATIIQLKETPRLVVMDEPELHLDPAWHALFVRSMRDSFPGTQFVLATQSPEIYDSVYSFQRRLLLPENDSRIRSWHLAPQGAVR